MSGLREEPRGAARWLILDRPAQRNALSSELIATLRGALVRADADAQARVICVTGSGEQAFCSGMGPRLQRRRGGSRRDRGVRSAARLCGVAGGALPVGQT